MCELETGRPVKFKFGDDLEKWGVLEGIYEDEETGYNSYSVKDENNVTILFTDKNSLRCICKSCEFKKIYELLND